MVNYSIIIPHYNIPDLLMRCLHSIPVRSDVQVIVVDDCSPGAEKYLERYPELSRPCLEFYSTPKGGSAGRARNVGLDHAKGKWLIFADADDFFVEDIDSILNEYVNADSDIVFFRHKSVMSENINMPSGRDDNDAFFNNYKKSHDEYIFRCDYPVPWGKMIKRSLVDDNGFRFDETRWSNDYYFSVTTGLKANKIEVVDRYMYILTERSGSLTHNYCGSREEIDVRLAVAKKVQILVDKSIYYHSKRKTHFFHILSILKSKDEMAFWKEVWGLRKNPRLMWMVLSNLLSRKWHYWNRCYSCTSI